MIWILLALWLVPPLVVFILLSFLHKEGECSSEDVVYVTMTAFIPIWGLIMIMYATVATFLEYVLKWVMK